ncbi:preprotein translocase subunit SecG [Paraburkholderia solisilvae]|uniref:Protein-export membrane protein SecG n=1 Tax=Paraburkholderia solisilvae TaxID=624376 RepID=A0A6J5EQI8_9BURK|nr:preprotein translocase subunit SecG [Paraburkholderia solisilvae]CAB3767701.1 Protein-export membrane protein SecG [Paraburkholderia solisilvae]
MLYLKTLIIVVQLLSALGIIGLVLLQHGKGADMGAAFGSGASGSLFGATGSANFLSRTTGVLAAIFFVTTLALTYIGAYHVKPSAGVLGTVAPTSAPVASAVAPASAAASASPAATSGATVAAPASPAAASAPGQDVPK